MFGRQKNVDGYFEKIGVFCQTLVTIDCKVAFSSISNFANDF